MVVLAIGFYVAMIIKTQSFSVSRVLLDPLLTTIGLYAISIFIAYPIEVLRPRELKGRWLLFLFFPSLIATLPLLAGLQFQELHNWSDLMQHFWDFDVLLRLISLVFVLILSLILLFIPFNWRESSADNAWIRNTTLVAQGITVFFCAHALTNMAIFFYLHVLWTTFALFSFTYYELENRILPPAKAANTESAPAPKTGAATSSTTDNLWQKISSEMNEKEIWRNPDASVEMLCTAVGSNRIYVADSIREHTGLTVNDYLNQKRTGYMVNKLRQDPEQDQKPLYFEVGYRSRQTAYRNFVKFVGCSPSDFVSTL